jgi:nucleoid-associated protein YgaU
MNKEIRAEVQRLSGLDKATCSLLLSGLERVFQEEVIHLTAIALEGLGTFVPHKHPEYLQDDVASGQVMLYPPRITCRFQPATSPTADVEHPQIDTTRLAALLADYVKLSAEQAAAFMHALVQTTVAHLQAGEEVSWTGFGTFRVVNFRDGASCRVAWVIDDKMREQINAPFSCFEPVPVGAIETQPEPEVPAEPEPEAPADPESLEEPEPEAPEVAPPTDSAPELPPEAAEITPKQHKSARKWIFTGIIFLFLVIICNICAVLLPTGDSQTEGPTAPVAALEPQDTALAISEEADEAEPAAAPEVIDDDPDEEVEADEEEPEAQAPASGVYRLDTAGNPLKERVQPGDRLTLMAKRLYGHKAFWVYIYEVNRDQLKSPNNVTAGMDLYLPNPEYWHIDSASEPSVQTALRRASQLMGE